MTINQAVKDYVKKHGITKDAFAESVGIKRTSFFAKMRGASDFTLAEAFRMSRVLGCTMDDFYSMTKAS